MKRRERGKGERGQKKLINRNEGEKERHRKEITLRVLLSFPTSVPSQPSKVSMEMNWLNYDKM